MPLCSKVYRTNRPSVRRLAVRRQNPTLVGFRRYSTSTADSLGRNPDAFCLLFRAADGGGLGLGVLFFAAGVGGFGAVLMCSIK